MDRGGHETPGHGWERFIYMYTLYSMLHITNVNMHKHTHTRTSLLLLDQEFGALNDVKGLVPACTKLHHMSRRGQSYIISLYDYVIKTVSLSTTLGNSDVSPDVGTRHLRPEEIQMYSSDSIYIRHTRVRCTCLYIYDGLQVKVWSLDYLPFFVFFQHVFSFAQKRRLKYLCE